MTILWAKSMLPSFFRLEMFTGLVVASYSSMVMTGMVRKQRKGDPQFCGYGYPPHRLPHSGSREIPAKHGGLPRSLIQCNQRFVPRIPAPLSQSKNNLRTQNATQAQTPWHGRQRELRPTPHHPRRTPPSQNLTILHFLAKESQHQAQTQQRCHRRHAKTICPPDAVEQRRRETPKRPR